MLEGNWKPIRVKDLKISHTFYADDVLLFGEARLNNLEGIMRVLNNFSNESGLQINSNKSRIIFSNKMHHRLRKIMAKSVYMIPPTSFGRYLGAPVSNLKAKPSDFDDILLRFKEKLCIWQTKFLNLAGRATLIKSMLTALPIHLMQTTMLPKKILTEMERGMRKFLWNKLDSANYLPRVPWDVVTKSKLEGGLGVKRLETWNKCFMAKLAWKIHTKEDSLWVKLMTKKYLSRQSFQEAEPKPYHFPNWKMILKHKKWAIDHSIIRIGSGKNISFWYEKWLSIGHLIKNEETNCPRTYETVRVSTFHKNGHWREDILQKLVSPNILKEIKKIKIEPLSQDREVWSLTKSGDFTVQSLYNKIISPKAHTSCDKLINGISK